MMHCTSRKSNMSSSEVGSTTSLIDSSRWGGLSLNVTRKVKQNKIVVDDDDDYLRPVTTQINECMSRREFYISFKKKKG